MARTVRKAERAPSPERSAEGLLPARELELRRAVMLGVVAGLTAVFVSAIGMVQQFSNRAIIGPLTLGYILLALIPAFFGYLAGKPPPQLEGYEAPTIGPRNVLAGSIAGTLTGVITALFVILVDTFNIRGVFPNISPELVDLLTFNSGLLLGSILLILGGAFTGTVFGAAHMAPRRYRRAATYATLWILSFGLLGSLAGQVIRGSRSLGIDLLIGLFGEEPDRATLGTLLYEPGGSLRVPAALVIGVAVFSFVYWRGGQERRVRVSTATPADRRRTTLLLGLITVALAVIGPWILGRFLSQVLVQAGIFLLMALGLNIVVGFAGLLDLGYVAFFAVGAYTTGVLTHQHNPADPLAFHPEMNFWVALPFVLMTAALAGIIVGTPVLRMRGDYLAIVTLGFGEITRLAFQSDWLKPYVGGARGVRGIPPIPPESIDFGNPQWFLYILIVFVFLAAYVSWAVQESRVGRAWMAMREDESVAEVMGVNTVTAKLSAFIIGALLAGLGGALTAAKVFSVFPSSFKIIVSIQILIIVIVGGMGSMRGVMLGALLLIALPEVLREFEFYRFLIYGALLIYMMLRRPEGLIPSRRRAAELHEEQRSQDAWLQRERALEREEAPQPARGEA